MIRRMPLRAIGCSVAVYRGDRRRILSRIVVVGSIVIGVVVIGNIVVVATAVVVVVTAAPATGNK